MQLGPLHNQPSHKAESLQQRMRPLVGRCGQYWGGGAIYKSSTTAVKYPHVRKAEYYYLFSLAGPGRVEFNAIRAAMASAGLPDGKQEGKTMRISRERVVCSSERAVG